jgi:hypothetical protein
VTNAASYATDQFVEIRIIGYSTLLQSKDTKLWFVLKNPLKENLTYAATMELGYEMNRVFKIVEHKTVNIATDAAALTSVSHPWATNLCGKIDYADRTIAPTTPRRYYAINDTTDLYCRV